MPRKNKLDSLSRRIFPVGQSLLKKLIVQKRFEDNSETRKFCNIIEPSFQALYQQLLIIRKFGPRDVA